MIRKALITLVICFLAAGVFVIYSGMKYQDAQKQAKLNAKAPDISITFPEGWTVNQMGDYLQKENITTTTAFVLAEKSFDISGYPDLTSKPKTSDLEGFLFPDTYFVPANPAAGQNINKIIIQKSLDNFSKKITPEMAAQATANGMDLYKTITLASIIEKETGADPEEKKIVAGIFYNRLNANIALGSDATVNYITGKSSASVSNLDTRIDSPYNTYKYTGLPPGPICNPGLTSIMAALYPTKTDYMYFLTDPATGKAVFAVTYEEHLKNKQKYLK